MELTIEFKPGELPTVRFDASDPNVEKTAELTRDGAAALERALEAVWPRPAQAEANLAPDHPADRLRAEVGAWRGSTRDKAQAARDEAGKAKAAVDAFAEPG